jgi:hypothetical protein
MFEGLGALLKRKGKPMVNNMTPPKAPRPLATANLPLRPEYRSEGGDFAKGGNGGMQGRLSTEYDVHEPVNEPVAYHRPYPEPPVRDSQVDIEEMASRMSEDRLTQVAILLRALTFAEKMEMCEAIAKTLETTGIDSGSRIASFDLAVASNNWAKEFINNKTKDGEEKTPHQ